MSPLTGYLIVSLHDGHYGITVNSPARLKLGSAGFLFTAICAFGISPTFVTSQLKQIPLIAGRVQSVRLSALVFIFLLLASEITAVRIVLAGNHYPNERLMYCYACLAVLAFTLEIQSRYPFRTRLWGWFWPLTLMVGYALDLHFAESVRAILVMKVWLLLLAWGSLGVYAVATFWRRHASVASSRIVFVYSLLAGAMQC